MASVYQRATNPLKFFVHTLLAGALEPFVVLTWDNFQLQVLEGVVRFTNVKLRQDALSSLKIPLAVSDGVIGSMSVQIPWTTTALAQFLQGVDADEINMGPIQLNIDDVRFSVKPLESIDFEINAKQELEAAIKRKLEAANRLWRQRLVDRIERWAIDVSNHPGMASLSSASSAAGDGTGDSATAAYRARAQALVMRLLTVSVKHVHVQYSDTISDPERPFRLGLILNELRYGPCAEVCCARNSNSSGGNVGAAANTPGAATAASPNPLGAATTSGTAGATTPHVSSPFVSQQMLQGTGPDQLPSLISASLRPEGQRVHFTHKHLHWDGMHLYIVPTGTSSNVVSAAASDVPAASPTTAQTAATNPDSTASAAGIVSGRSLPASRREIGSGDAFASVPVPTSATPTATLTPITLSDSLPAPAADSAASADGSGSATVDFRGGVSRSQVELLQARQTNSTASRPDTVRIVGSDFLSSWIGVDAHTLQFVLYEVSGAVTLTQHALHVASKFDPPQQRIDAHVDALHLEIQESQFAHIRALLSYGSHVARFARYRQFQSVRPSNRRVQFLSAEQQQQLHGYLIHRRLRAAIAALMQRGSFTSNAPAGTPTLSASISSPTSADGASEAVAAEDDFDPYASLAPGTLAAIRVRARSWWKFAISCVVHDLRESSGSKKRVLDAATKVEIRNRYIRLFRQEWCDSGRPLVVPQSTLPGFSVLSVTRAPKSEAKWISEWACDVGEEVLPAHVVSDLGAAASGGTRGGGGVTGHGGAPNGSGQPQPRSAIESLARSSRHLASSNAAGGASNVGQSGVSRSGRGILAALSPRSVRRRGDFDKAAAGHATAGSSHLDHVSSIAAGEPLSPGHAEQRDDGANSPHLHRRGHGLQGDVHDPTGSNFASAAGSGADVPTKTAADNRLDPEDLAGGGGIGESRVQQLLRRLERDLSIDEITHYRILAETQLVVEHLLRLQRLRQRSAFDRVAEMKRKISRNNSNYIIRSVLRSAAAAAFGYSGIDGVSGSPFKATTPSSSYLPSSPEPQIERSGPGDADSSSRLQWKLLRVLDSQRKHTSLRIHSFDSQYFACAPTSAASSSAHHGDHNRHAGASHAASSRSSAGGGGGASHLHASAHRSAERHCLSAFITMHERSQAADAAERLNGGGFAGIPEEDGEQDDDDNSDDGSGDDGVVSPVDKEMVRRANAQAGSAVFTASSLPGSRRTSLDIDGHSNPSSAAPTTAIAGPVLPEGVTRVVLPPASAATADMCTPVKLLHSSPSAAAASTTPGTAATVPVSLINGSGAAPTMLPSSGAAPASASAAAAEDGPLRETGVLEDAAVEPKKRKGIFKGLKLLLSPGLKKSKASKKGVASNVPAGGGTGSAASSTTARSASRGPAAFAKVDAMAAGSGTTTNAGDSSASDADTSTDHGYDDGDEFWDRGTLLAVGHVSALAVLLGLHPHSIQGSNAMASTNKLSSIGKGNGVDAVMTLSSAVPSFLQFVSSLPPSAHGRTEPIDESAASIALSSSHSADKADSHECFDQDTPPSLLFLHWWSCSVLAAHCTSADKALGSSLSQSINGDVVARWYGNYRDIGSTHMPSADKRALLDSVTYSSGSDEDVGLPRGYVSNAVTLHVGSLTTVVRGSDERQLLTFKMADLHAQVNRRAGGFRDVAAAVRDMRIDTLAAPRIRPVRYDELVAASSSSSTRRGAGVLPRESDIARYARGDAASAAALMRLQPGFSQVLRFGRGRGSAVAVDGDCSNFTSNSLAPALTDPLFVSTPASSASRFQHILLDEELTRRLLYWLYLQQQQAPQSNDMSTSLISVAAVVALVRLWHLAHAYLSSASDHAHKMRYLGQMVLVLHQHAQSSASSSSQAQATTGIDRDGGLAGATPRPGASSGLPLASSRRNRGSVADGNIANSISAADGKVDPSSSLPISDAIRTSLQQQYALASAVVASTTTVDGFGVSSSSSSSMLASDWRAAAAVTACLEEVHSALGASGGPLQTYLRSQWCGRHACFKHRCASLRRSCDDNEDGYSDSSDDDDAEETAMRVPGSTTFAAEPDSRQVNRPSDKHVLTLRVSQRLFTPLAVDHQPSGRRSSSTAAGGASVDRLPSLARTWYERPLSFSLASQERTESEPQFTSAEVSAGAAHAQSALLQAAATSLPMFASSSQPPNGFPAQSQASLSSAKPDLVAHSGYVVLQVPSYLTSASAPFPSSGAGATSLSASLQRLPLFTSRASALEYLHACTSGNAVPVLDSGYGHRVSSLLGSIHTSGALAGSSAGPGDGDGNGAASTWIVAEAAMPATRASIHLCGRDSRTGKAVTVASVPIHSGLRVVTTSAASDRNGQTMTVPEWSIATIGNSSTINSAQVTVPLFLLCATVKERDAWIAACTRAIDAARSRDQAIASRLGHTEASKPSEAASSQTQRASGSSEGVPAETLVWVQLAPATLTLTPSLVRSLQGFTRSTGSQFEQSRKRLQEAQLQEVLSLRALLATHIVSHRVDAVDTGGSTESQQQAPAAGTLPPDHLSASQLAAAIIPWSLWRQPRYVDDVRAGSARLASATSGARSRKYSSRSASIVSNTDGRAADTAAGGPAATASAGFDASDVIGVLDDDNEGNFDYSGITDANQSDLERDDHQAASARRSGASAPLTAVEHSHLAAAASQPLQVGIAATFGGLTVRLPIVWTARGGSGNISQVGFDLLESDDVTVGASAQLQHGLVLSTRVAPPVPDRATADASPAAPRTLTRLHVAWAHSAGSARGSGPSVACLVIALGVMRVTTASSMDLSPFSTSPSDEDDESKRASTKTAPPTSTAAAAASAAPPSATFESITGVTDKYRSVFEGLRFQMQKLTVGIHAGGDTPAGAGSTTAVAAGWRTVAASTTAGPSSLTSTSCINVGVAASDACVNILTLETTSLRKFDSRVAKTVAKVPQQILLLDVGLLTLAPSSPSMCIPAVVMLQSAWTASSSPTTAAGTTAAGDAAPAATNSRPASLSPTAAATESTSVTPAATSNNARAVRDLQRVQGLPRRVALASFKGMVIRICNDDSNAHAADTCVPGVATPASVASAAKGASAANVQASASAANFARAAIEFSCGRTTVAIVSATNSSATSTQASEPADASDVPAGRGILQASVSISELAVSLVDTSAAVAAAASTPVAAGAPFPGGHGGDGGLKRERRHGALFAIRCNDDDDDTAQPGLHVGFSSPAISVGGAGNNSSAAGGGVATKHTSLYLIDRDTHVNVATMVAEPDLSHALVGQRVLADLMAVHERATTVSASIFKATPVDSAVRGTATQDTSASVHQMQPELQALPPELITGQAGTRMRSTAPARRARFSSAAALEPGLQSSPVYATGAVQGVLPPGFPLLYDAATALQLAYAVPPQSPGQSAQQQQQQMQQPVLQPLLPGSGSLLPSQLASQQQSKAEAESMHGLRHAAMHAELLDQSKSVRDSARLLAGLFVPPEVAADVAVPRELSGPESTGAATTATLPKRPPVIRVASRLAVSLARIELRLSGDASSTNSNKNGTRTSGPFGAPQQADSSRQTGNGSTSTPLPLVHVKIENLRGTRIVSSDEDDDAALSQRHAGNSKDKRPGISVLDSHLERMVITCLNPNRRSTDDASSGLGDIVGLENSSDDCDNRDGGDSDGVNQSVSANLAPHSRGYWSGMRGGVAVIEVADLHAHMQQATASATQQPSPASESAKIASAPVVFPGDASGVTDSSIPRHTRGTLQFRDGDDADNGDAEDEEIADDGTGYFPGTNGRRGAGADAASDQPLGNSATSTQSSMARASLAPAPDAMFIALRSFRVRAEPHAHALPLWARRRFYGCDVPHPSLNERQRISTATGVGTAGIRQLQRGATQQHSEAGLRRERSEQDVLAQTSTLFGGHSIASANDRGNHPSSIPLQIGAGNNEDDDGDADQAYRRGEWAWIDGAVSHSHLVRELFTLEAATKEVQLRPVTAQAGATVLENGDACGPLASATDVAARFYSSVCGRYDDTITTSQSSTGSCGSAAGSVSPVMVQIFRLPSPHALMPASSPPTSAAMPGALLPRSFVHADIGGLAASPDPLCLMSVLLWADSATDLLSAVKRDATRPATIAASSNVKAATAVPVSPSLPPASAGAGVSLAVGAVTPVGSSNTSGVKSDLGIWSHIGIVCSQAVVTLHGVGNGIMSEQAAVAQLAGISRQGNEDDGGAEFAGAAVDGEAIPHRRSGHTLARRFTPPQLCGGLIFPHTEAVMAGLYAQYDIHDDTGSIATASSTLSTSVPVAGPPTAAGAAGAAGVYLPLLVHRDHATITTIAHMCASHVSLFDVSPSDPLLVVNGLYRQIDDDCAGSAAGGDGDKASGHLYGSTSTSSASETSASDVDPFIVFDQRLHPSSSSNSSLPSFAVAIDQLSLLKAKMLLRQRQREVQQHASASASEGAAGASTSKYVRRWARRDRDAAFNVDGDTTGHYDPPFGIINDGSSATDIMRALHSGHISLSQPLRDPRRPWRVLMCPTSDILNGTAIAAFAADNSVGVGGGGQAFGGLQSGPAAPADARTMRTSASCRQRAATAAADGTSAGPGASIRADVTGVVIPSAARSVARSTAGRSMMSATMRSAGGITMMPMPIPEEESTSVGGGSFASANAGPYDTSGLSVMPAVGAAIVPSWFLLRVSSRSICHSPWLSRVLAWHHDQLHQAADGDADDDLDADDDGDCDGRGNADARSGIAPLPATQKAATVAGKRTSAGGGGIVGAGSVSGRSAVRPPAAPAAGGSISHHAVAAASASAAASALPPAAPSRGPRTAKSIRSATREKMQQQYGSGGLQASHSIPLQQQLGEAPSNGLLQAYSQSGLLSAPAVLLVTVTLPLKRKPLTDEGVKQQAMIENAKRQGLESFTRTVEEADRLLLPLPVPVPAPINPSTSSHMRVWLSNVSYVYFKRWNDEIKAIVSTTRSPIEKENLWLASLLPRPASFDHMVVDVENLRVIVPPSSACPDKALVLSIRNAAVRNELLYVQVPALSASATNAKGGPTSRLGGDADEDAYDDGDGIGAVGSTPTASASSSMAAGYTSRRRSMSMGALPVHGAAAMAATGAVVGAMRPQQQHLEQNSILLSGAPGSLISVPLERLCGELIGVDAALIEPLPSRMQQQYGSSSTSAVLSGLIPSFVQPGMSLSPVVDMHEATSWMAGLAAVNGGAAPAWAALTSLPLSRSTQTLAGSRLSLYLDTPIGPAFRTLSPLLMASDLTISGGMQVSAAVDQITLMQDIQKANAKEGCSFIRLQGELHLPATMTTHVAAPQLKVQSAEVATRSDVVGELRPRRYLIEKIDDAVSGGMLDRQDSNDTHQDGAALQPGDVAVAGGSSNYALLLRPTVAVPFVPLLDPVTKAEALHVLQPLLRSMQSVRHPPHGHGSGGGPGGRGASSAATAASMPATVLDPFSGPAAAGAGRGSSAATSAGFSKAAGVVTSLVRHRRNLGRNGITIPATEPVPVPSLESTGDQFVNDGDDQATASVTHTATPPESLIAAAAVEAAVHLLGPHEALRRAERALVLAAKPGPLDSHPDGVQAMAASDRGGQMATGSDDDDTDQTGSIGGSSGLLSWAWRSRMLTFVARVVASAARQIDGQSRERMDAQELLLGNNELLVSLLHKESQKNSAMHSEISQLKHDLALAQARLRLQSLQMKDLLVKAENKIGALGSAAVLTGGACAGADDDGSNANGPRANGASIGHAKLAPRVSASAWSKTRMSPLTVIVALLVAVAGLMLLFQRWSGLLPTAR